MKLLLDDDNLITSYVPDSLLCNPQSLLCNGQSLLGNKPIKQIELDTAMLSAKRMVYLNNKFLHSPNGITDPLTKVLLAVHDSENNMLPRLSEEDLEQDFNEDTKWSDNITVYSEDMTRLNLFRSKSSPTDSTHSKPLQRQGGVKRRLIRASSSRDPTKNVDIVLDNHSDGEDFSAPIPRGCNRAKVRSKKVNNIKRAAVCSLYLSQRAKSTDTPSPAGDTTQSYKRSFSPITPPKNIITNLRKNESVGFVERNEPLIRSRSLAVSSDAVRSKTRMTSRANSCCERYITLPDMSVREEITWARKSIKLYRKISQISHDNRTDSYLDLDTFFSEAIDDDDDIFTTVAEEEDQVDEEEEDEVEDQDGQYFDYLYQLSSLYRTTHPFRDFGGSRLKWPWSVCCNNVGDVFVSDWEAGLIYQLENIEDEVKNTFPFPCAFGVGVDGTNLYVTSQEDERLYLHRSGKSPLYIGDFSTPDGIGFLRDYIYVVEEQYNRICMMTSFGESRSTFGDESGDMSLSHPGGIAVYPEQELLAVCDRGNKRISLWDRLGNPIDKIDIGQHPDCCAYAGNGILAVGTSEGEVLFLDLDCKKHVFTWTNKQLRGPGFITGVAVDNRQNVYICDPKNHRVIKVYR